jgi:nitronate monooxygenase
MREAAIAAGDAGRMQAWAGQSAGLAPARPAAEIARGLWAGAREMLG